MTDELTPERLREWAIALAREDNPLGEDLHRVADAWDRGRREIERLRAERDTLQQNWQRCVDHAARVEEENGRLREALEKVAQKAESHTVAVQQSRQGKDDPGFASIHAVASDALAATTDSQVNPEKRDDT